MVYLPTNGHPFSTWIGVELATCWLQVWHHNHYTINPLITISNNVIIPERGDQTEPQEAIPSMQRPTPLQTLQTGGPERCRDTAAGDDQHPLMSRVEPSHGTACIWTVRHLATTKWVHFSHTKICIIITSDAQLNSTQVYWNTVARWLKEIQYIKTNKTIKVNEVKTRTIMTVQ